MESSRDSNKYSYEPALRLDKYVEAQARIGKLKEQI
jgi:hypothetical protein